MGKKSKKIAIAVIIIYALIGLFNSFLANNKPIVALDKDGYHCPACVDFMEDLGLYNSGISLDKTYQWAIYPLVPYGPSQIIADDIKLSPLKGISKRHYLGTDRLGRDLLAGVIRGCFTSFKIGLFVVLISGFIGVLFGLLMAYFGNDRFMVNKKVFIGMAIISLIAMFYIFYLPSISNKIFAMVTAISLMVFIHKKTTNDRQWSIPIDNFMNNVIVIRKSVPSLMWILALIPLFKTNASINIIIVMSLLGWANYARHARSEALSLMSKEFVITSQLAGHSFWHVARKHLLPLIIPTIAVVAGSSFSGSMLAESGLSFLGLGLPADEVSWGMYMQQAKVSIDMWWLGLFPGLALFIIVFAFNTLGESSIN